MTNYFPYVALNATDLAPESEEMTGEANLGEAAVADEFYFKPEKFVENLQYMGKGMLGILIVMGAIIIATTVLNAVSSRKKKDGSEEE